MEVNIIRSNRKSFAIEIRTDLSVTVRAPYRATNKDIEKLLHQKESWIQNSIEKVRRKNEQLDAVKEDKLTYAEIKSLADKALKVIPQRVRYFAKLIGVDYGRITIRNQISRWGSCSSKGNLNFNCLLMLTPEAIRDSVIVHELAHLIEMNHSPRFYQIVRSVYPQYDNCHKWLKENGIKIIQD